MRSFLLPTGCSCPGGEAQVRISLIRNHQLLHPPTCCLRSGSPVPLHHLHLALSQPAWNIARQGCPDHPYGTANCRDTFLFPEEGRAGRHWAAHAGWGSRRLPSDFVPVYSSLGSYTSTPGGWRGLVPASLQWDTGRDRVFTSCFTEFVAKRSKISAEGMSCCLAL